MDRGARFDSPVRRADPPYRSLVLLVTTIVCGALLAGASRGTVSAQKPTAPAPGRAGPAAEAIYKKHCQLCHLDGNAPLEPLNFANGKWAHGSRMADVVKVIRDGVPGTAMIAFKDILTADEIRAVAEHVRAFDKSLKPEKPMKR